MKVIIESSGIGNILPSITIELDRHDLGKLVSDGKITLQQIDKKRGDTDYYQETKIIVK